ncbi:MAG: hypothetical protein M3Z02_02245, partial [Actinomycetota bacterium]|nr:hypothetical protein [Actinomycetota bacterium]
VGPIDGTPVAGYIDAAKAELARRLARDPAESAYAVVDLAAYTSPTDAAAAVAAVPGLASVRALARVSLKDQPTDVLEASVRALPADLLAAFAAQSERRREDAAELRRLAASIDGSSPDEMAFKGEYTTTAGTAQLESDAYGKNCACVFALVLTGRISALSTLAGRPGIRVVDVAPGGVAASVLAFVGLLPEQTTTVMPVAGPGPALPVPAGKSPAAPPTPSPSK